MLADLEHHEAVAAALECVCVRERERERDLEHHEAVATALEGAHELGVDCQRFVAVVLVEPSFKNNYLAEM